MTEQSEKMIRKSFKSLCKDFNIYRDELEGNKRENCIVAELDYQFRKDPKLEDIMKLGGQDNWKYLITEIMILNIGNEMRSCTAKQLS